MSFSKSQTLTTEKRVGKNKLVVGVMVAAITAIVGTAGAGVAYATNNHGGGTVPQSKEQCKNEGWKHLGWSNQGQCVSAYATQHNHQGGGYGNGPQINVNANVNGNNNVINFIIKWIVG